MPNAGSQVILCDLPVRFDTYRGCSHACSYCFVTRNGKYDISNIKKGDGVEALKNWIQGKRTKETNWVDWNIPLHWGGVSDPFQPIELKEKISLQCLKVFKETQYPFVVSTKNTIIATNQDYFNLLIGSNCVVQVSLVSPQYDRIETGAPTFFERLKAVEKIAKHRRVIIRVQPYITSLFPEVLKNLELFKNAGAYGVVIESMKYFKKAPGLEKVGADFVYPIKLLKPQFQVFKDKCHELGLRFYSGENRLRKMGDSLCCCGIEGMGWKENTANLNHYLYDNQNFEFTSAMAQPGTASFASTLSQESKTHYFLRGKSYKDVMELFAQSKSCLKALVDR